MNSYFRRNPESLPYLDRLVEEWEQHGKIIIAVDFDDTISPWKMGSFVDFERIISILKEAKLTGAYIVIFTSCSPDRFYEIKEYCGSKGLSIDSINVNPIQLPYGNHGKIYANIFIDDRAGLNESLEILELAIYQRRAQTRSEIHDVA